ncbi:hypothetical protein ACO0LM_22265 [Undibacterium sp. Di26W]
MSNGTEETPLLRQLWILFSDVNTRFNLLIDECAHLQNTIFGYMDKTTNADLGTAGGGEERPWLTENIRSDTYYLLSPQERALRSLWNSLGSLAYGLESEQKNIKTRFEQLISAQSISSSTQGPELYWFISLRGSFLHDVFEFYLTQIQHAHEKLIQVFENMSGVLPGPILLRKWGAASYVEFLSSYSRNVNYETQNLLWKQTRNKKNKHENFEEWRASKFLTHAWAHVATSMTKHHRVEKNSKVLDFQTIWSSYFYLEQPILLPLLYHECAHHYMNKEAFSGPIESIFFDRKRETAHILEKTARFEGTNQKFWMQFVDEVWADTVSILLGGQSYLAALFLQIIGLSGKYAFSRFDYQQDERLPLEKIGTYQREVREIPWPDLSLDYFWEARLNIAINTYRRFYPAEEKDQWLQGILDLLDAWRKSGENVFHKDVSSSEHETFWHYRCQLNKWVTDICRSALNDCYKELGKSIDVKTILPIYRLAPELINMVQESVQQYKKNVLRDMSPVSIAPERLEDICIKIRWDISKNIVSNMFQILKNTNGQPNGALEKYTQMYASYMRSDGSAAFRLAYEWLQARSELYKSAAEALSNSTGASQPLAFGDDLMKKLQDAAENDNKNLKKHKDVVPLFKLLAQKKHSIPESEELNKVVDEIMEKASQYLKGNTLSCSQIRIGTLTYGVIRSLTDETPFQGKNVNKEPLWAALVRVRDYYKKTNYHLKKLTSAWGDVPDFKESFFPLIGDYSFLHFIQHKTPVERDCHPVNAPKILTKSRLVLQVYGESAGIQNPGDSHAIGRVVQMRFKHRWEWIPFIEKLEILDKNTECKPALFLSSGWEDAILVLWHKDETEWLLISGRLKLEHKSGLDVHTNVIMPMLDCCAHNVQHFNATNTTPAQTSQTTKSYLSDSSMKNVKYLNQRTGRYDLTVVWCDENGNSMPIKDFWKMYVSLPGEFWSSVSAIVTSVEKRLRTPTPCTCDDTSMEIVSHILLKH